MTVANGRPVAAVDALWLHMDTPENLMVIEGVMTFAEPLDYDRALAVISWRLPQRYPVFRQIPMHPGSLFGGDIWVDDPDFDVANHVHRATLPDGGDDAALTRFVSAEMSKPIPHDRPLWQVVIIDGYRDATAILFRFHHAMADGTALARVLLELTDDRPDADLAADAPAADNDGPTHQPMHRSRLGSAVESLIGVTDRAREAAQVLERALSPQTAHDALEIARVAPTLIDKLFVCQLPDSPLRKSIGVRKVAAWSPPYDLAKVKATAHAHNATVNDVMVAGIAGAIRSYTIDNGAAPEDLATMVPVNLRPLDRPLPRELGNKFALVVLQLPLSAASPTERLLRTKSAMDNIKNSPEALVTFGIIEALGSINPTVTKNMVKFFSGKGIGITTNVIGPRNERFFAGRKVASIIGWAPSAGDQTLNECIFSFGNQIQVGFKSDRSAIPEPEQLVEAFDHELQELMRAAER